MLPQMHDKVKITKEQMQAKQQLLKIQLPDSYYHEHYKGCLHMGNHPEHVYPTSSDGLLGTQLQQLQAHDFVACESV